MSDTQDEYDDQDGYDDRYPLEELQYPDPQGQDEHDRACEEIDKGREV